MNIEIGPDGQFSLTLPSGRKLFITNTPYASDFIFRTLWESSHEVERKGYIGAFPTQAITDAWFRDSGRKEAQEAWLKEKAQARREDFFRETGINLDEVRINI